MARVNRESYIKYVKLAYIFLRNHACKLEIKTEYELRKKLHSASYVFAIF